MCKNIFYKKYLMIKIFIKFIIELNMFFYLLNLNIVEKIFKMTDFVELKVVFNLTTWSIIYLN